MAEKEYIPIEEIEKHFGDILNTEYVDDYATGFKAALKAILSYSTVDVTPIRHGHWILTKRTKIIPTDKIGIKESFTTCRNGTLVDENNINKKAMIIKKQITIVKPKCSECGYYGYDEDDITPYCPNCGCKLDNESEEK